MDNETIPAKCQATIVGAKAIQFTLSAVETKLRYIEENLSDDGTGYMVTPEGWDENDIPIFKIVIEILGNAADATL